MACVREWVANIFYRKGQHHLIMIDAGYNYDRWQKMDWLGIDPQSIRHILITSSGHRPRGRGGGRQPRFIPSAKLYIGEIENRYLTGEVRRKVISSL